ncbi:Zinc finger protein [Oopsacas minuta]|uniref:Zinc finger protein n=1 Tax=Oopsacas minuta TaxID=111878 RepID=A0AAV7JSH1_9METZ|nr:Zinc finger protein [Oopsacas minuta]
MVERRNTLTVDEFAFCHAMRCMYYLNKHEIAHTTNFSDLRVLCILLGNKSLSVLKQSGNTNYESEQIMGEIVEVIGITLEEEILSEHEAAEGEATAHGLCNEIVNPTFIASLLLLSNILAILGNLSRTFQLAQLNLLAVEQLVEDAKVALCVIKEDPLHGGYMMDLEATMKKLKLLLHLKKLALLRMPNHTLVPS